MSDLSAEAVARGVPKRFLVVALCFLATFICYMDRVNISVAIIPMAKEYGWSETTKGWVLSSFFIGYLLSQIPSGWIANRYGGKLVLGVALVSWSAFTFLTPIAAGISLAVLIVTRVAMGIGEAPMMPCLYNLAARWLPAPERSRSITIMIGGIPLGTIFALAAAGWLVSRFEWPVIFYVFGGAGLLFAIVWFRVIHASPTVHPGISADERAYLERSTFAGNGAGRGEAGPIPWGVLLRKPAVWALISNHFCSNWSLYVLLTWLPTYFSTFQELNLGGAGLFSAAPWLLLFLVANLTAVVADRLIRNGASVTAVRKTMQITGLLGSAAFLLVASHAASATAALFALCGSMGMLGFTWSGFGPNHLDIAPRYADVLSALTNTAGTIPGVAGVVITGWLLDTTGDFSSTFILAACVNVVGAVIWAVWSTGRRVMD